MNELLVIRDDDSFEVWEAMRRKAEVLVKSKFLPKAIETPEQALAIILTGRELGIGDMAALRTIDVIQGTPTIKPQLMLALINKTRQLEDISITDNGQACTVMMKRRGMRPQTSTFSMADAQAMKTTEIVNGERKVISLSEKYNWRQQPAVMRQWRAIAACARKAFPDVILGLYTPEEIEAAVEPLDIAETPQEAPQAPIPVNDEVMHRFKTEEIEMAEADIPPSLTEREQAAEDIRRAGSGLDQWRAGRAMAMRIIGASAKLKTRGVSEDQIRRWLPEGVTSRKDLEGELATEFLYNLNLRLRLMMLCKDLAAAGVAGDEIRRRLPGGVPLMRDLTLQQVADAYRDFTHWLADVRAGAGEVEFIN
jgi:hypothetical protein